MEKYLFENHENAFKRSRKKYHVRVKMVFTQPRVCGVNGKEPSATGCSRVSSASDAARAKESGFAAKSGAWVPDQRPALPRVSRVEDSVLLSSAFTPVPQATAGARPAWDSHR